jgi:hypothetical protein
MADKPRDLWLALSSIVIGILLYLIPKTGLVIVLCLLAIFALLIHPAWHFWWIEKRLWRRIALLSLLAISLVFLGGSIWPSHEGTNTASFDLAMIGTFFVRSVRYLITIPWRWISVGAIVGCLIGVMVTLTFARKSRKRVEAKLFAYQWLHDLANQQAANIDQHVELERPFVCDARLRDSMPSLGFKFPIRNWSVFRLSIAEKVEGRIHLNGKPLADLMLLKHIGQDFGFKELDGLSVEQRFTTTEANQILTNGGLFSFTDLKITIKGRSRSPQIQPQRLTITSDHALALDANLNEKSAQSEEISALKQEVTLCKDELAKLKGLAFGVDTNFQSDAKLRAHEDIQAVFDNRQAPIEIDMYILTTQLKVCFENNDINDRTFKRMELSLIKQHMGSEEVIRFLEEPVMLSLDPDKNMEKQRFPKVVFLKQSTITLWLLFDAHIPPEDGAKLNADYFLRFTLFPLGQPAISQDLNVDWNAALENATYITSRTV